ncbi:gag poly [Fusarium beomiforme]|uniref:Gag poly n=1 Tax=Fusarium beomiforme TaxID=44412 RepID=A0A9P5DZ81_9HYPO|nr:gag poly [Fusarium beomiforme]
MSSNSARPNTAGSGPAPPYSEGPPSNAEMMAEITALRNLVNRLQVQANERAAAPAPAPTVHTGRDPGESLKPPKPEPFRGLATDVVPFLTRMKAYFSLFPTKLSSAKSRVLFTAPLIQGNAQDWFEPILRDFLENEDNEALQDQETINIFADWNNFEIALKDNFGVVNEERQAAADIMKLRQDKSCAAYSAKFRQLAAKTQWDDDALMEIYYQGLKEEVKDELYKADRPDTLNEYATMAIKIDERQYERRKERAARAGKERGSNFNPYYPNQKRNNNNNNNNGNRNNSQNQQRNN